MLAEEHTEAARQRLQGRLRALEGIDVSLEDIADSLGRIERNGLPITDAPQV